MNRQTSPTQEPQFRTTNPTNKSGWDELIGAHPACTFFHGSAWAEALQKTYGHEPYYLVLQGRERLAGDPVPSIWGHGQPAGHKYEHPFDREAWLSSDQRLLAALPLMEVNSPLTGRRGVCLPFTDACPALLDESVSYDSLFRAAVDLGTRRAWRYLEIRGGDVLPAAAHPSKSFVGHCLQLEEDEEAVAAGFKPSVRQALRKALRERVQWGIDWSFESLRAFYRLHCLTRQRHGVPPQPFCFFENIFQLLLSKQLGFVAWACWRGAPVAAAIFLCHGSKAVFKYGASDTRSQHVRGSDLVMAESIRWLCRHGFKELDLGRTSLANEGLCRFKRGFGAWERRIDYVRFDVKRKEFVRDQDWGNGWLTRALRRLPPPVFRLVGGLVYRHLS